MAMSKNRFCLIAMNAATLLHAGAGFTQEIEVPFPEDGSPLTISGQLSDRSPTYVITGVEAGREAEATLHAEGGQIIFCRSEIDHSHRTTARTTVLEGKLYFCIENLDWRSGEPRPFTMTVSVRPDPTP